MEFRILNKMPEYIQDIALEIELKKESFEKNLSNIETLLLGSSELQCATDASMMKNAFNLGLKGFDLYTISQIFLNYYKKMPNLKNIVLFYSPFFNDYDLNYTEQWWYVVFSKILFGIKYRKVILKNIIYELYCKNKLTKIYRNNNCRYKCSDEGCLGGLEYINIQKHINRFSPGQFEEHNLKTALGTIKNCFRGKSQFKYLEQMYKTARQQNLNFILCYPCYSKEWVEYMPHEKLLFKLPNDFVKENNVKLINCYNLHYDTHFYIDYNHLNKEGAKLFTLDFVNLLKEHMDF